MAEGALRGKCCVCRRALRQLVERAGQATYAINKRCKQGETSIEGPKLIVRDGDMRAGLCLSEDMRKSARWLDP